MSYAFGLQTALSIRVKIVLVVVPLVVSALLISGAIGAFGARSGITRVAMRFLSFKAEELEKQMLSQWTLLVANDLIDRPEYRDVTIEGFESFARTLLSTESELIFALDANGVIVLETSDVVRTSLSTGAPADEGWFELQVNDRSYVGHLFRFDPLDWTVVVSDSEDAFFREVNELTTRNIISTLVAAAFAVVLLLVFTGYLTRPIVRVAAVMDSVIAENDLSRRVEVEYADEVGQLAHSFNRMAESLSHAYDQIKSFAFDAVLAERNERKIRHIFQKYVPKDVIETFFNNPESMLVGQNRDVAVFFSDIRSFTTISESFEADALVNALNRYFSVMVDAIMNAGGVVDKYIGDAVMALFGAPIEHRDDALRAVRTALGIQPVLREFNEAQRVAGLPEFRTGIGISYGEVTVGNIGTERKMDYTVIGDMVNLASRLEGLTKIYHQDLIFSAGVYERVNASVSCRLLDTVMVKGRTKGERIFTAAASPDTETKRGWQLYHEGLELYAARRFRDAARRFGSVLDVLPEDRPALLLRERSERYAASPPGPDWSGVEVLTEK